MGKGTKRIEAINVILVGLGLLTLACDRVDEDSEISSAGGGQSAAGAGGSGGEISQGSATVGGQSVAGAGGSGGAGGVTISGPLCSTPIPINAPTTVDGCVVVPRTIDPESTCGAADCPIIRTFDLSCEKGVNDPELSLIGDRTFVLVQCCTSGSDNRLLTVTDTETEISRIGALLNTFSERLSSASTSTWYVARGSYRGQIVAVTANGEIWSESTVVPGPSDGWPYLSDAATVDETLGYVAYRLGTKGIPHLVTWDGACWTDEMLTDAATHQLRLGVDADGLPWMAWVQQDTAGEVQIVLRDPTGESLPVYVATEGSRVIDSARSVSVLPGGFDGHDPYPTLTVFDSNGINVVRRDSGSQSGWSAVALPDSSPGSVATDCPEYVLSFDPHPCGDQTSCTTQIEGNGVYYGLARTASQGTFAVWLDFSSLADSVLSDVMVFGGEMPNFACGPSATTGSGTAELVLARLGNNAPVITRYRFDLDAGLLDLWKPIAVAARGDILVVTAEISGGDNPALTYFEIDSRLLP